MMTAEIIDTSGYSSADYTEEFARFGLKIGDKIEVKKFVSNAYYYKPKPDGDVLFLYNHQVKLIEP